MRHHRHCEVNIFSFLADVFTPISCKTGFALRVNHDLVYSLKSIIASHLSAFQESRIGFVNVAFHH
jgi:hypothetical protein